MPGYVTCDGEMSVKCSRERERVKKGYCEEDKGKRKRRAERETEGGDGRDEGGKKRSRGGR